MDGVRAYWDGETLYSKSGKEINAPLSFLQGLPAIPLDGELWIGRQKFEKLLQVMKTKDSSWKDVSYVIFDLPHSMEPYESRMDALKKLNLPIQSRVIDLKLCQNQEDLQVYLNSIVEGGGEGIVAREPGCMYKSGRTSSFLKVKVYFTFNSW
jgi:DNA ligase-1